MIQGFSEKAIARNIQELIRQGKTPSEAQAIAEAMASKARRQQQADGGEVSTSSSEPLKANLLGLALQRAGFQQFAGGGVEGGVNAGTNGADPATNTEYDPENRPDGRLHQHAFGNEYAEDDTQMAARKWIQGAAGDAEKWWNENQQNLFGGGVQAFQAYGPGEGPYGDSRGVQDSNARMAAADAQGQEIYGRQNVLGNQLAETAAGRGPSMADMQNQQATQRNIAGAASMAASARGVNPALAARMAGEQASNANQQAAGQAMMGRLAEQRSAQEQLGNLYGQQATASNQRQGIWGGQYGQNLDAQMGAQEINAKTNSEERAADQGMVGSILGGIGQVLAEGGEVDEEDESLDEKVDKYLGGIESLYDGESSASKPKGAQAAVDKYLGGIETLGADNSTSPLADEGPVPAQSSAKLGPLSEPTFDPNRGKLPDDNWAEMSLPARKQGSEFLDYPGSAGPTQPSESEHAKSVQWLQPQYISGPTATNKPQAPGKVDASMSTLDADRQAQRQAGKSPDGTKSKFDTGKLVGGLLSALLGLGYLGARRANARPIKPFADGGDVGYGSDDDDEINSQVFTGEEEEKEEEDGGILSMFGFAEGGPGGHVPGSPPVPGHTDTTSNDIVPALLSPGEIVLPRTVTKGQHPEERAAGFVLGVKSTRAHPLPSNTTPEDLARLQARMLGQHADGGEVDELDRPIVSSKTTEMAPQDIEAGRGMAGDKAVFVGAERDGRFAGRFSGRDTGEQSVAAPDPTQLAGALRDFHAAKEEYGQTQSPESYRKVAAAQAAAKALRNKMVAEQSRYRAPMLERAMDDAAAEERAQRDLLQTRADISPQEKAIYLSALAKRLQKRADGGEIEDDIDKYLGGIESLDVDSSAEDDDKAGAQAMIDKYLGGIETLDAKKDTSTSALDEIDPDEELQSSVPRNRSGAQGMVDRYLGGIESLSATGPDYSDSEDGLKSSLNSGAREMINKYLGGIELLAQGGEAPKTKTLTSGADLMDALPKRRPSLRKALMFQDGGVTPPFDPDERRQTWDWNAVYDDLPDHLLTKSVDMGSPGAADALERRAAREVAWSSDLDRKQRKLDEPDDKYPINVRRPVSRGDREGLAYLDEVMEAEMEPHNPGPIQMGPPRKKGSGPAPSFGELIADDAISQAVNMPGVLPPPPPLPPPGVAPGPSPAAPPSPAPQQRSSSSVSVSAKARVPGPQGPKLEQPLVEQPAEKAYFDANKDLIAALQSNADVAGKTALMQAALLEKGEAERRLRQETFDATQKRRQAQLDELAEDIRNSKIDPANLWNSKSTGQKVMSSISIMFGAMAQGLQGLKTNPVVDLINRQIDQDIEAQKSNLGKKQSLFRHYMDLTDNEIAAEQYARSDLLASTAAQMQLVSLKMGGEQAQAGANYAIAALRKAQGAADTAAAMAVFDKRLEALKAASEAQEREARIQHMERQDAMGRMALGIKSRMADAKADGAKDDFSLDVYVNETTPSGASTLNVVPKKARDKQSFHKAQEIQGSASEFAKMMDEYITLADRNPHGGTPGSADVKRMRTLHPLLRRTLSQMQGQGVIRNEEREDYELMIPDATEFKTGILPAHVVGLRTLRETVLRGAAGKLNPLLEK